MSEDQMPAWPADEPTEGEEPIDTTTPICERIDAFLQRAINDRPQDLGAQIVGDWFIVAEVSAANRERPVLRMFDSDLPSWRRDGLLRGALKEFDQQELLYSIAGIVDGEDFEGDDNDQLA